MIKKTGILFIFILLSLKLNAQQTNIANDSIPVDKKPTSTAKDSFPEIKISYLLTDFTQRDSIAFDTLPDRKQNILKAFNKGTTYTNLGRIGMVMQNNYYFDRYDGIDDFLFLKGFNDYIHTTANTQYYFNTKPYTLFEYKTAGPDNDLDQVVKLVHSQTRARKINFGFDVDAALVSSKNYNYNNQNIGATFFGGYSGDRYKNNVSIVYNTINNTENGGGIDDAAIVYDNLNIFSYAKQLTDKEKAASKISNWSGMISQGYYFGQPKEQRLDSSLKVKNYNNSINYIFKYDYFKRNYSDFEKTLSTDSTFYRAHYFNADTARDSVVQEGYTQEIQLNLSKIIPYFPFLRIAIFNQNYNYRFNGLDTVRYVVDTMHLYKKNWNQPTFGKGDTIRSFNNTGYISNYGVRASLWNDKRNYLYFGATGELFISGYRKGDALLQGYTGIRFGRSYRAMRIEGNVKIQEIAPEIYYNQFLSNHLAWSNNFKRRVHTKFTGKLLIPYFNLSLKFNAERIDRYIYIDQLASPQQLNKPLNVWGAELEKLSTLWHFSFYQSARWQQTDEKELEPKVLPLPTYNFYFSNSYNQHIRFHTGGTMLLQLGFDFTWYSKFVTPAYMPATGMFYQQSAPNTQLGNYGQLDAFLKIKVKRLTLLTRFDHINAGGTGFTRFGALHYPMAGRTFWFGISWLFYD